MRTIKGAGVLLLEKVCASDQTVLLFACQRGEHVVYEELGGAADVGEAASATASREAREESCNMLRIDPNSLRAGPYVDVAKYRCYVAYLPPALPLQQVYASNRLAISDKPDRDAHFLETLGLTRVRLSALMRSGISTWAPGRGALDVLDVDGEKVRLFNRTAHALKRLIATGLLGRGIVPRLELRSITDEVRGFLKGTVSLHLTRRLLPFARR